MEIVLADIESINRESPGRIALCTDTNSFKDSAGSQLLHHPPGVISEKQANTNLNQKHKHARMILVGIILDHVKHSFILYSLKWELFIIGFNAAHVVRGGGIQGFHQ